MSLKKWFGRQGQVRTLGIIATACIAWGACRVPPPVYVIAQPPEAVQVPGPPPPPIIEVQSLGPGEGYVWQDGYWNWEEEDYQWVDGQWVEDRPGMALVEESYLVINGQWTFQPPYWTAKRHVSSPAMAHGPGPVFHPHQGHVAHKRVEAPPEGDRAPHKVRVEAPPAGDRAPHNVRAEAPPVSRQAPPSVGGIARAVVHDPPAMRSDVVLLVDAEDQEDQHLKKNSSYRGNVDGRPTFGDDPQGRESHHGYPTDHTGAIILSSSSRVRRSIPWRGSMEVMRQDPTTHFRHREAEGGRPPLISVVRPEPRPSPVERPSLTPSNFQRTRVSSSAIDYQDISRRRSAMQYGERPSREVHRPNMAPVTRTISPSSSGREYIIRSPQAHPRQLPQASAQVQGMISRRPPSVSTAAPSSRGNSNSPSVSTRKLRHR